MVTYIAKQLTGLVSILILMSLVVFSLQRLIPADPARAIAGPTAPTKVVHDLREELGLDQPVLVQYGRFLADVATGDMGASFRTRQPVAADILRYLPATLELIAVSVVLGLVLACGLALVQYLTPQFALIRVLVLGLGSTPIFLSGLILIYAFWFSLDWLPGTGRLSTRTFSGPTGFYLIDGLLVGQPLVSLEALRYLLLPSLTLALPIAVAVSRSLSSTLYDVMRQPYIRSARGMGLTEARVILRHGLRNAASAPLSMTGLQIRLLFGNLLVVERIFGWPGVGLYMVQSLSTLDLPAVLGVSMVFGAIYIVTNAMVEICQTLSDPRIDL
ncbi:ABC transporter permease [Agrobacterium tumefaciens]|uniref:ABC transporter permease n=1 Tax=Agrobacterium tumefaciens TaxID=358 RepID=UPI003B9F7B01